MTATIAQIDAKINALLDELETLSPRDPERASIALTLRELASARNAAMRAAAPGEFSTTLQGTTLFEIVKKQLRGERRVGR